MAKTLAVKYRPNIFEDVCGQSYVVKVLKRQLELKQFKNCYLFSGPSGTGKTTLARIFANQINQNLGAPIEIDAASNNGVDNIKNMVKEAKERSVYSQYKIFIIDECHMITTAGWNAFLKCIEEPPEYSIFIFCTTDPQKIPATILNRVQKFNLSKIKSSEIFNRLVKICINENIYYDEDSISFITKLANGGMRDAISMLDKCASYSKNLNIESTLNILGNYSYDVFFSLTNSIIDGQENNVLSIVENYYSEGQDLKLFVEQYLEFIFDLTKYCIFKDLNVINIPSHLIKEIEYDTSIEDNTKYFVWLSNKMLDLKNLLKNDIYIKTTIEITFLNLCRNMYS